GLDNALHPGVAPPGLHRPRAIADDEVRLLLAEPGSVVPPLIRRPNPGRRHVFEVALQRALIDPGQYRRDLFIAERSIILELLDSDGLVDMPRRHLARLDSCADRARPRTCLLVG